MGGGAGLSPDTGPVAVEINDIQSHALLGYYLDGWERWGR